MLFVSTHPAKIYVSGSVLNTAAGIMQDSIQDWEEAASTMASIYENSYITISASWASDSSRGLFSSPQYRHYYEEHKLDDSGLYARRTPPPFPSGGRFSASMTDWPLLKRGWVFQETTLAPRVIHYARDQLYWECNSRFLDEYSQHEWHLGHKALDHTFENGILPLKNRSPDLNRHWRNMISLYTNLDFTYSKDVLPALAGIVEREMRYRKDDVYIAGMWENSLLEDLAFHVYKAYEPRKNSRAPTWSWASMESPIEFLEIQKLPSVSLVKLEYERTAPANIGHVINATLRVRGPILSVKYEARTFKPLLFEHGPHALSAQTINAISNIRIQHPSSLGFPEYFTEDIRTDLKILVLSSYQHGHGSAILLEPVSTGEVLRYRKLDAVYVEYHHEVGQAYYGTVKYAQRLKNQAKRVEMVKMRKGDNEAPGIYLPYYSRYPIDEGKKLMNKLIDLLSVQEVEII
jgi:hypothetical protein